MALRERDDLLTIDQRERIEGDHYAAIRLPRKVLNRPLDVCFGLARPINGRQPQRLRFAPYRLGLHRGRLWDPADPHHRLLRGGRHGPRRQPTANRLDEIAPLHLPPPKAGSMAILAPTALHPITIDVWRFARHRLTSP